MVCNFPVTSAHAATNLIILHITVTRNLSGDMGRRNGKSMKLSIKTNFSRYAMLYVCNIYYLYKDVYSTLINS